MYTVVLVLLLIIKRQILQQCTSPNLAPPVFNIKDCPIANVDEFVYLGTVLNSKLDLSPDIQRRVRLASFAFGRLSQRVFLNRNLNLKTKMAVYMAVCVSTLLYGCEAWVLYRRHIKTLEQFHISCLQRMLRLRSWDKVPLVEIRHRAHCLSMEAIIAERQLRWTGHIWRAIWRIKRGPKVYWRTVQTF